MPEKIKNHVESSMTHCQSPEFDFPTRACVMLMMPADSNLSLHLTLCLFLLVHSQKASMNTTRTRTKMQQCMLFSLGPDQLDYNRGESNLIHTRKQRPVLSSSNWYFSAYRETDH